MECTASFAGKARLIIPPQDRNRRLDLRQLKVRIAGWGGWQSRLCWNAFRGFGSRRRDDTKPGFYGHTHTRTERRVHVQVTGVSCVQMDFVVVAHWCVEVPKGHAPGTYKDP